MALRLAVSVIRIVQRIDPEHAVDEVEFQPQAQMLCKVHVAAQRDVATEEVMARQAGGSGLPVAVAVLHLPQAFVVAQEDRRLGGQAVERLQVEAEGILIGV